MFLGAKMDKLILIKAIKSWYYSDKVFGWAIDEDEFIEDLANHILEVTK